MLSDNINYTNLCEVEKSIKVEYHVYGIIVDCYHKLSYDYQHQHQNEYRLKLKDGTNDKNVDVTIYGLMNSSPPIDFEKGAIYRFHRLGKQFFKRKPGFYLYGKLGVAPIFMFKPPKNDQVNFFVQSSKNSNVLKNDTTILTRLLKNSEKILQGTYKLQNSQLETHFISKSMSAISAQEPSPQIATYHYEPNAEAIKGELQSGRHECSTEIRDMVAGNSNYFNVLCEVVSCYHATNGDVILRVWDGTQNSKASFLTAFNNLKLIYGNVPRELHIAGAKRLYEVRCYDEHGLSAKDLKAGDYVVLVNVHFFIPNGRLLPCLIMHQGKGTVTSHIHRICAERRIAKITEENAAEHVYYLRNNINEGEAIIKREEYGSFDEDIDFSITI